MNRDVTIWSKSLSQALQLSDRAALRNPLKEDFGFDLPEVERFACPSFGNGNDVYC